MVFGRLTWARDFLKSCLSSLSRRGLVFAVVNAIFFGSLFVSALLSQFLYPPPPYEGEHARVSHLLLGMDWPSMLLGIFLFNLALSAFALVTLPGLLFPPLSLAFLAVRAWWWGALLNQLPTHQFLATLPTLFLEGEGYVTASVAGIILGFSWLKPNWVHKDEGLPRLQSLNKAFRECARIYTLVAVFLLVAAAAETATILHLT